MYGVPCAVCKAPLQHSLKKDLKGNLMAISSKLLRMQLAFFKPFVNGCTIETARIGQAKLGDLMANTYKNKVLYSPKIFRNFLGEWVAPKSQKSDCVILYLHGGGYVAGDIDYAKGFGTTLAAKNGVKVFCAAYRLAPEYRYPAALEDAVTAYEYLLESGYENSQIFLCGESAGGGLIYALTLKLKDAGRELPAGIIAISPWTDLTGSGASYEQNRECDPSMTRERLQYYAELYADDYRDPYVSPLFGALDNMPPSLIFVGGDEVMLDDAVEMHRRLQAAGSRSELVVTPEMWHGYILYGVSEAKKDHEKIAAFLKETQNGRT